MFLINFIVVLLAVFGSVGIGYYFAVFRPKEKRLEAHLHFELRWLTREMAMHFSLPEDHDSSPRERTSEFAAMLMRWSLKFKDDRKLSNDLKDVSISLKVIPEIRMGLLETEKDLKRKIQVISEMANILSLASNRLAGEIERVNKEQRMVNAAIASTNIS